MIAGEIVPPGCYLSAIEILRRQYVAHLADLAARGQLPGVLPMPRRASALFGESGWLRRLVAAATSDSERRRPARRRPSSPCSRDHVDDGRATTNSAQFARTELKAKADEAEDTWNRRLDDLRDRLSSHRQGDRASSSSPTRCSSASEAGTRRRSGAASPSASARSAAPTRTARSSTSACCRTTR